MNRAEDAPETMSAAPSPVATGVIMIAMAIAVWWPAFTLGAWGELFFDQILTVWAASTAAFFFIVFDRRPQRRRVVKAIALLLPSVWLVLEFIAANTDDPLTLLGDAVGFIAVFFAIPFTIWILVRVMWPEFGNDIPVVGRWMIVVSIAVITTASFLLGVNHPHFLTCEDFAVSGNSEPAGCTHLDELP
ncbi:hypothetical protein [Agromyces laixinhei]|uniref:hypothetical protein n=1 Tax=Agromyces laixinhei TaxID=2585717 RepID=UPI001E4B06CF|nr:hypothetical protein [Agromyces laixinhei]